MKMKLPVPFDPPYPPLCPLEGGRGLDAKGGPVNRRQMVAKGDA